MDREALQATVHRVAESNTTEGAEHAHMQLCYELVLETQKDSFLAFFSESFHVRETTLLCAPMPGPKLCEDRSSFVEDFAGCSSSSVSFNILS